MTSEDKRNIVSRIGSLIPLIYGGLFIFAFGLVFVVLLSSSFDMEQRREKQALYDAQPHDGISYYAVDPVLMKNGHECNLGNNVTAILPKNESCNDSSVLVEGTNKVDTISYYKTDESDNSKPSITLTEATNVRTR